MKYLILGCNGMAGHIISKYLIEKNNDVYGFAREESKYVETIVGDALNTDFFKQTVINGNFDTVVNCIGILNQFAEQNRSQAVFLNSYLPHYLAEITSNTDTQIIHISTDCVFSGRTGSYTEDDIPDGQTFYDRTKALGELVDGKNLTLRQSIIGPDIKTSGIGLLNWFMKQNGQIKGYTKSIWTGQTTLQLAKTIEYAAQNKISGLYNAVPDISITKFELLELFNHYFKNDELLIEPVDGVVADKSLIRKKTGLDITVPDYDTMLSDLSNWMKDHKDMYPHYDL